MLKLNECYFNAEPGRYEAWTDEGLPNCMFRGPRPPFPLAICIGAAQTFGRGVDRPFPHLTDAMNLGVGGVAPRFFDEPVFIETLNSYPVVVIQVMSARTCNTAEWMVTKHPNTGLLSAICRFHADGRETSIMEAWDEAWASGDEARYRKLIASVQVQWLIDMKELISKITVPTVLLYFAKRKPADYKPRFVSHFGMTGRFPHFVDAEMVDRAAKLCTKSAIVLDPGDPKEYYPSQAGHDAAGDALFEIVRKLC